jgi:SAM-dependent methyltransferase
MSTRLHDLASLLQCPGCGGSSWVVLGTELSGSLTCTACGSAYASTRGVLDLGDADEDPQVTAERAAVRHAERRADLGGIDDAVDDLASAQGELRDALLALPHGNSSRYFLQPGYFANVRASAAGFDFLVDHLDLRPGRRLLDLGADATWSTSQFARRGLDCTAVDINHHLPVGRLFADHHGAPYHLVRADMRRVPFRPETFDIVLAVSALHHNPELKGIASTIARVLRPGGQLAFLEPYCENEGAKRAFGLEQIAAGISEQTYLLQEWHDAFAAVGLEVETHRVCDSFCAVYRKRTDGAAASGGLDVLFRGTYAGRILLAGPAEPVVTTGTSWTVPVTVENSSHVVWCSTSHFMIRASYHLYRRIEGREELVAFDNVRTPLPQPLAPGQHVTIPLEIAAIAEPGDYVLDVDMLHEFVSWFGAHGFAGFRLPFTVVRRPSSWWPFRRGGLRRVR